MINEGEGERAREISSRNYCVHDQYGVMDGSKPRRRTFRADRAVVPEIDPAETDESSDKVGKQPVGSTATQRVKEISPVEGIVTSERSSSSSEIEDEERKLGIEDNAGRAGMSPTSGSLGVEVDI